MWCNKAFPGVAGSHSFLEANMTLFRLLRLEGQEVEKDTKFINPWKPHPMTFTCHTTWVVRVVNNDGDVVMSRPLQVHETMRFIGWCDAQWASSPVARSSKAYVEMSGNAYSGFSVVPLLGGLFAALGCAILTSQEAAKAKEENPPDLAISQQDQQTSPEDEDASDSSS